MHMNVHGAVGIILSMLFSNYLTEFQILFFVGVSIIIDFDFLLSRYARNHNHRRLITHTYLPYIIFIIVGFILWNLKITILNVPDLWIYFFLFGISGFIHVSLDSIDWGILLLYPFRNELIGGVLTKPKNFREEKNIVRRCYFVNKYYSSKLIIFLEIGFVLLAILSIILVNVAYFYLIFVYIFTLGIHLPQFFRCKKEKDSNSY